MTTEEETEPDTTPQESNADPTDTDFFDRAFKGGTTEGPNPGEPADPLEVAEFTMAASMCGKYLKSLGQDFIIQIRSLTPKQELECTKNVESGSEMLINQAQRCIAGINGSPVGPKGKREWLWKHLGPQGRQTLMGMYAQAFLGADDPKALAMVRGSLK